MTRLMDIVGRRYNKYVEYRMEWTDKNGSGFSFPCDKDGNVDIENMSDAAKKNYEFCVANPDKFDIPGEFFERVYTVIEPAKGRCVCGRTVELRDQYMGACECGCGRWYNLFGQELLPPEYWRN